MDSYPPPRRVFADAELQRRFDRDGYVVLDAFLSEDEVRTLRAWWEAHPDPVNERGFAPSTLSTDVSYRLEVTNLVGSVYERPRRGLFDDYRFIVANYLSKKPHGGIVYVHQDPSFVFDHLCTAVEIWCPLVDVDARNGCMRVIRGSHRLNRTLRPSEPYFPYGHLSEMMYAECMTELPMRAGQALVFTQMLFHSSLPNQTDRFRVAAGALYVPREAQLIYVNPDDRLRPTRLEVFEAPDLFYTTEEYTRPPKGARSLFTTDYAPAPLDEHVLRELVRSLEPAIA
jgi:ectoine hydroxylase-related dioxygenase (phytanoyl-CoA dioxygenase family)